MRKIGLMILTITICIGTTRAQDRFFARTYTSNVLPKGAIDLEFWHTSRFGHQNQFYHAQDQRMEVEFGLGRNVQAAFYFNRFQKRESVDSNGTNTSNELGFSNEWKWKLSDPTANALGAALYGEWGLKGGDELELETKIILDKNIGKSLFAFNGIVEFEKEFEWEGNHVEAEGWETPVELDLAYMYNVNKNLGLGFELRDVNGVASGNGWEYSSVFGGPTINYRSNRFFVIANYQPQWSNIHKTAEKPFTRVLDEHERAEARILVGISL